MTKFKTGDRVICKKKAPGLELNKRYTIRKTFLVRKQPFVLLKNKWSPFMHCGWKASLFKLFIPPHPEAAFLELFKNSPRLIEI